MTMAQNAQTETDREIHLKKPTWQIYRILSSLYLIFSTFSSRWQGWFEHVIIVEGDRDDQDDPDEIYDQESDLSYQRWLQQRVSTRQAGRWDTLLKWLQIRQRHFRCCLWGNTNTNPKTQTQTYRQTDTIQSVPDSLAARQLPNPNPNITLVFDIIV